MQKKFVSVDVETSGSTPGKYSMLSIGACIVGQTDIQFYRELKPITKNYIREAMKVACLGLHNLAPNLHFPCYNPRSDQFEPEKVLGLLAEKGEEPEKVMGDFASWISANALKAKVIEAARPIKFDGSFTAYYFDNFHNGNPLGHSGLDIPSFYKGLMKDADASFSDILPKEIPHNALEDAIIQAEAFEKILKQCKGY